MGRQELNPVVKHLATTVIGGLGGRTRTECWAAESRHGVWGYERSEGNGSLWYLIHLPTGWTITGGLQNLTRARARVSTGSALLELWLDAQRELVLPEAPDPGPITNHDRARGVLTWLGEHEPGVLRIAERRALARRMLEQAARAAGIVADLDLRIAGNEADRHRLVALRAQFSCLHSELLTSSAALRRS